MRDYDFKKVLFLMITFQTNVLFLCDETNVSSSIDPTLFDSTGWEPNKIVERIRGFDNINLNDINVEEVKEIAFTEQVMSIRDETSIIKQQKYKINKYAGSSKYRYESKHSRKNKKYDTNSKSDSKMCKDPKKYECKAFFLSRVPGQSSNLLETVEGGDLELSSVHVNDAVGPLRLFSNKARGSYRPYCDLEASYQYLNLTLSAARYEYDGEMANLLYETPVTTSASILTFYSPFAADVSLTKGFYDIDAYMMFSPNDAGFSAFSQYDIKTKTGQLLTKHVNQGLCFDIYFFSEECSRLLCQSLIDTIRVIYLHDAQTTFDNVPPLNNEVNAEVIQTITAARFCNQQYLGLVRMTNAVDLAVLRAKVSLKYPYFTDVEQVAVISGDGSVPLVYSAKDTDTLYICQGERIIRIDNAYTGRVPIQPSVDITHSFGANCIKLLSFSECPNQVYVSTSSTLWYSGNGGLTFNQVLGEATIAGNDLTGFAVPYKKYI